MVNLMSLPRAKVTLVFGIETVVILVVVALVIHSGREPKHYFGEGSFITWLSTLQLLGVAHICHRISRLRFQHGQQSKQFPSQIAKSGTWKNPARIWQVMMIGFVFLALDEIFMIHETIDNSFHVWFGLEKTELSGRIDDFIVLLYVIVGALFFRFFWKEFLYFSKSFGWLLIGFALSFLMIFLDMISHSSAPFAPFFSDPIQLRSFHIWLQAVEEMVKIWAGGALLLAFDVCLGIARREDGTPDLGIRLPYVKSC